MVALIWVLCGLGFAYRWLCGGWFARIVMGILFIPVIGYALFTVMWFATDRAGSVAEGMIAGCVGIPSAWWLAGVPARWAEKRAIGPSRPEAPQLLFPRD